MSSVRTLIVRNTLAAILLPLLPLTLFIFHDLEQAGRGALDRSLVTAAQVARGLLRDIPANGLEREVGRVSGRLHGDGGALGIRLTVIAADGTVLADTEGEPSAMDNHGDRPEVRDALRDGAGYAERQSSTLKQPLRYVALAEQGTGGIRVYRIAAPMQQVYAPLRRAQFLLLGAVAAVLLLTMVISSRLSRYIVAPVEALSAAAARFSAGAPEPHVVPEGPEALRRLARAYNAMVDRILSQVHRLDEAQGYLDAVIRQMPEGLLVTDAGGTVIRANPAAVSLLDLPLGRIVGRTVLSLFMSYALDQAVRRVLEGTLAPEEEEGGVSVTLRTPEGKTLRVAVGPLEVLSEPAGAVVILQDMTELRRVDDMRRDFVANVSHELRTPIAAIRALAETLTLRGEKRPELIRDYVPRIVTECERIDFLVRDLLLLAQAEAGQAHLAPEPLDSWEVVEEVLRQVEPLLAQETTRLEMGAFTGTRLLGDRVAVGQCVRNLVDNAVRHAPGGTVRIGSREEDGQVVLYVSDTGPGIPPEDLPRIFERFYRVDKGRTRESGGALGGGSGLGLSIVRHLCEAQGGRAWAESRVGQGSTFHLAFPRSVD